MQTNPTDITQTNAIISLIDDAIADSLGPDWTSFDAAHHVFQWLQDAGFQIVSAAFAEREAQHRETLAVLQTAHESEVMMQAKIDRLADLLAKACGDIAALLVFGNREGDIRSWTAEYAEALNEHDAALKDRTHG